MRIHQFIWVCLTLLCLFEYASTTNIPYDKGGEGWKIITAESTVQLEQRQRELNTLSSRQKCSCPSDWCHLQQGWYMSQPATQSSTPVVAYVTMWHFVNTDFPTVSYPQGKSLTDLEKLSVEATIVKFNANNITVAGVLCNGSGQLSSVLNKHNIEKLEYVEHSSLGQEMAF